jgi:hypothetical protein
LIFVLWKFLQGHSQFYGRVGHGFIGFVLYVGSDMRSIEKLNVRKEGRFSIPGYYICNFLLGTE